MPIDSLPTVSPAYEQLLSWAQAEDVHNVFAVVAATFGFSDTFTVIGNLSAELSHPESQQIVESWSDNPIVSQLRLLNEAYSNSCDIKSRFPIWPHRGQARSTAAMLRQHGADIQNRHFLLFLLVTPLAGGGSEHHYLMRRQMRLWLLVESIYRAAKHGCLHDSNVQRVSGFLTKDLHDPNWIVVDQLLDRANQLVPQPSSFRFFSAALGRAAEELRQSRSEKASTIFLGAITKVAQGECAPTIDFSRAEFGWHGQLSGSVFDVDDSWFSLLRPSDFNSSFMPAQLLATDSVDDIDADEQEAFTFEVNPTDSLAQQRLSGQSLLLQTSEQSHYLPWSWDTVLPPEVEMLTTWMDAQLSATCVQDRLGAAFVWLAARLGRSLAMVLQLAIEEEPAAEWGLAADFTSVMRWPPRRHSAWYPRDQVSRSSVAPFAERLALRLPVQVTSALADSFVRMGRGARDLHELWFALHNEKPDVWFARQTDQFAPRLSSAKLAQLQPQRAFALTGDHSLARMIAAHPRSALPAACGYSNWDITAVERGFELTETSHPNRDAPRINLFGSLLEPLESLLIAHIGEAKRRLVQARSVGGVSYHNSLTQYVVMALYAATGARYLADPFESPAHFSPNPPAIFINDKTDSGVHNGRMVPLPLIALAMVDKYRSYLRMLADAVYGSQPELALGIRQLLANPAQQQQLPYFFQLDEEMRWHSVSARNLPGGDLFDWPLPPNLMRHRYAQQLSRSGVDHEVVDAWMGHAERGVATYGDTSVRCWLDDVCKYQPTVDDIFAGLGFDLPIIPDAASGLLMPTAIPQGRFELRHFGQKRRALQRTSALKRAITQAREDLNLLLRDEMVDQLVPEQIDQIARKLVLKESGLPHPQAAIRLQILNKMLAACEGVGKSNVRKRIALIKGEYSLITERCPLALTLMAQLKQWAKTLRQTVHKAEISKSEALAIGTAFLIIDKRITYSRLLQDVASGKNYRLIQHKRIFFIEYSEHLDPENLFAPIQRHEIDYKTASLLGHGLGIRDEKDLSTEHLPRRLAPLLDMLTSMGVQVDSKTPSLQWLLQELSQCVMQANLIQLPGVVAAALSDRRPATSLPLYDYMKLRMGIRYELPDSPSGSPLPASDGQIFLAPIWHQDEETKLRLQQSAKAFFRSLHRILDGYARRTAKSTAKNIARFCRAQATEVSPTILLVGFWLADRIQTGKGRTSTRHNAYAANSVRRYLSTMTEAFQGLAFNTDVTELDAEAITLLCEQMLTFQRSRQRLGDSHYFGARLKEFFRWAAGVGVVTPYWDELDMGDSARSVTAGILTEAEYLTCIETLQQCSASHPDYPRLSAFVLMLAFRFGLRAGEASGLMRDDWCESAGVSWVLVRNNALRELKRPASRRAVPLMFPLSQQERQLIDFVVSRYHSLVGERGNKPILCELTAGKITLTAISAAIPSAINRVLRAVTGNRQISLHQARHAFYNRLAPIVQGYATDATNALNSGLDVQAIRRLLLGPHNQVSRRSSMALARAMGHSTPHTSLRSYDHFLTEWADTLTPVSSSRVHRLPQALQAHEWPEMAQFDLPDTAPLLSRAAPSPANVCRSLRLLALGYSADVIEEKLRLNAGSVSAFEPLVYQVSARLRFRATDSRSGMQVWVYGDAQPRLLLKKITPLAWSRLLERAESLPEVNEFHDLPVLAHRSEVPNLVGRNGHLLMDQREHCELIKLTVKLFEVNSAQYEVVTRTADPEILAMVKDQGFQVSKKTGQQLDTYNAQFGHSRFRGTSYAGLIFHQAAEGCVRNRNELVLALLIVAAAYCQ